MTDVRYPHNWPTAPLTFGVRCTRCGLIQRDVTVGLRDCPVVLREALDSTVGERDKLARDNDLLLYCIDAPSMETVKRLIVERDAAHAAMRVAIERLESRGLALSPAVGILRNALEGT